MDKDKEKVEISLIGRLFSLEALILVMGLASLVLGLISGKLVQIFWGVTIITGSVVLHFVRKKDWKKHWEEQERQNELYRLKEEQRKERERHDSGKS